jgi:hypothetical protein
VLVATSLRIDGALAQLRSTPSLSDLLDELNRSGIDIGLRAESGAQAAPLLAALMLLGGLIELALPLRLTALRSRASRQPWLAPALQTAGASIDFPAAAPSALDERPGERRGCVQCGKSLRVEARFCNGCGAQQE